MPPDDPEDDGDGEDNEQINGEADNSGNAFLFNGIEAREVPTDSISRNVT